MVRVDAGHDEEDARAAGAAAEQPAEPEDDDALVLLHDFDGEAERDGQRDEDQDDGAEGDEVRADAGTLVARCKARMDGSKLGIEIHGVVGTSSVTVTEVFADAGTFIYQCESGSERNDRRNWAQTTKRAPQVPQLR